MVDTPMFSLDSSVFYLQYDGEVIPRWPSQSQIWFGTLVFADIMGYQQCYVSMYIYTYTYIYSELK